MEKKLEKINEALSQILELLNDLTKKFELLEQSKESRISTTLIKIKEAALLTGYSVNYIYDLIHKKSIPYIKIGRSVRFDCNELEAWVRAGRPDVFNETIKSLK